MSRLGSVERLLSVGAAASMLSGCGGSGVAPPGASSIAIQTQRGVALASGHRSWMLQSATNGDLIYGSLASGEYGPAVYVYSYPGGELVGKLTDFPSGYYLQGLCTDRSGDVFVTAAQAENTSQSNIYEYAHGGTSPIATLSDPGSAAACAVDPTTGNLAVANASTGGGGDGDVAIYQDAQGAPTLHADSNIESFAFCAYDNEGNLFTSGSTQYYTSNLFELPKGSGSFTDISLNKSFFVSSVQWVGGRLSAAEFIGGHHGEQPVYQIQISGSSGTVSEPTLLRSRHDRKTTTAQFWVQGGTILSFYYWGGVGLWRYPKGGRPTKVIGAPYGPDYGMTVSVSRHR
jgi:hypothetical protein